MLVKVKVTPEEKDEAVTRTAADSFQISVREKAENGLANNRTRELLAIYLGVIESKVRLVKGAHEPHKIFEIRE